MFKYRLAAPPSARPPSFPTMSTASSSFVPPPFQPPEPVAEYILHVAQVHPDREVALFLEDAASVEEASTTSITWRQFLADVWERVDYLQDVTGLRPRSMGKERVVVGLLAESNYDFLVDFFAMFMLRWQVCSITLTLHANT